MYSVGEFSRLVGVHPNTLRRWEREGRLLPHHRTIGGQRVYSDEQVKQLYERQVDNNEEKSS